MALSSLDKAHCGEFYPLTTLFDKSFRRVLSIPPGSMNHGLACGNGWHNQRVFKTTDAETPYDYIDRLEEPRRTDIRRLHELIRKTAPDLEPHIASGMLAYGRYHYRGKSKGTEGEWMHIALASNKRYISLYVMATDPNGGRYLAETYRDRLPKADIGRSCVRIKRIDDVDQTVLTQLIHEAATFTPIGAS